MHACRRVSRPEPNLTRSNRFLTSFELSFIVWATSQSRFVSFDTVFMIDFIYVRKYFIHREKGISRAMSWRSSQRRSMFEGKQKQFAAETSVADDPGSVDENMDLVLPTDGRGSRVGVLLASLSALTSLSAVYLALHWFTGS